MLNPIRSLLAATGLLMVAALAAAGFLVVAGTPAHAACQITGPSTAIVNQSFTLCGPSISGSTYEWYGPGISVNSYSRCVDVDGLARGAYEFVLVRRVNDNEVDRCTKVVNVGGSSGGVTSCVITGPDTVEEGATATLCAPQDGIHSYTWTGPNGATSSAGCITVSDGGTYTLTSRNRLTGSARTCTHRLTVSGQGGGGGSTTGNCDISGPTTIPVGTSVQLCAPSFTNTTYRWTGPNGFISSSRCINADDAGTYWVTMRNNNSGRTTRCSQVMSVVDQGSGNTCDITGPTSIPAGSSAQICAPAYANTTFRWTGPGGYVSSSRCINVRNDGTYVLAMRNTQTGRTTRCSQVMTSADDGGWDDPDNTVYDNCPRDFQFWRRACNGNAEDLTRGELSQIARSVDARSSYLNWANDLGGFCQALRPGNPLTRKKQVIRQYTALLANVAAGQANLDAENGSGIGIDLDTPVNFGGAQTVGELIALTERLLTSNRGDFAKLNATLNQLNRSPCE